MIIVKKGLGFLLYWMGMVEHKYLNIVPMHYLMYIYGIMIVILARIFKIEKC